MVSSHMTFGEKLREIRETKEIGVREIARSAGLSLSHYQSLEKDDFSPTTETIGKLARALGMPKSELRAIRDDLKVETDLTILLREAGELDQGQRERLLKVARDLLSTPNPTRRRQKRATRQGS